MFGPRSSIALSALVCLLAACSPVEEESAQVQQGSNPPAPIPSTETLPDVRQVIPGRAVHVPDAGTELERLPAPPVEQPPPRPTSLGIVVFEEANRLRTRRGMVTLMGTEAIDSDAICRLSDGRTPLCAVIARTAVRRFVGRRVVSCTIGLREDANVDHAAPCFVANTDLALWIVAQGWAFADADASAEQRAAETEARSQGRGLWAYQRDD